MRKLYLLIATLLGFYAAPSSAQIFKLTFNPAAGLNPAVADLIKQQVQTIQDDINKSLPAASTPDRLMKGMANSSVMAGKGIGTDYASGMKTFIIGAGVGVGADLTKSTNPKADISGAGVQPGVMVGTNLGWMDTQKILGLETNKLNVFVNFMSYNYNLKTGDTDGAIKMQAMGAHVSYDWIEASTSKMWGWGGLKLTTGFEHNSTRMAFTSKINKVLDYTNTGVNYHSNINANPAANIDIASTTIPLNISTSIRMLYVLSLYGGLGMDYSVGKATGKGNLNSSPSTVTCSPTAPGTCPGGTAGTVGTSANIDGSGKADPFLYRGFVGLQFNLPYVRIFVQGDKAFGNNLVGATAGVRFVF